MRATDALRNGISRVNRAPVILACVFLVTLTAALPFSMIMRADLQAHLGNSLTARQEDSARPSSQASSALQRCSTTSAHSPTASRARPRS
jgi:hypothetical protein